MRNTLILVLVLQFFCTELFSQKVSNAKILGKWQFTQISLISPKQGYIPTLEAQEVNLMRISMANYTFNEDGSVGLSEEYMQKTGVAKATWKLNADQTGLDITYYFSEGTDTKSKTETFSWKVESVTATDLSLKLQKMFMVKFKRSLK